MLANTKVPIPFRLYSSVLATANGRGQLCGFYIRFMPQQQPGLLYSRWKAHSPPRRSDGLEMKAGKPASGEVNHNPCHCSLGPALSNTPNTDKNNGEARAAERREVVTPFRMSEAK